MRTSTFLSIVASFSSVSASTVYKGFNYGSTFTDGTAKAQSDFQQEFNVAKNLVGASGFTSARLYTMIQGGTTSTPIAAIPAAIAEEISLLLGIWVSGGQDEVTNEILALTAAIQTYGTSFTDLVVGLSVGSEDLYRNSPTGIENDSGVGANPADVVNYITQVKTALSGTPLSGVSIGHVDTWNAWTNGSNNAVIEAIDWLGVDEYPYFQNTESNSIDDAYSLFWAAYNATAGAAGGKPVWITETGWPVSGKTENLAIASLSNAQTFWDEVGCASAFGKVNTWWYVLQDAAPTTPNPSFGLVGTSSSDATLSTTPLYDLSCANVTLPSSLLPSSTATNSASTLSGSGALATATTVTSATGGDSQSTKSSSASASSTSKPAGSGGSTLIASSSFLAYAMFAAAALF